MPVRERVRALLIRAYNGWLAFRSARERSVKNIARGNTRAGFQKIFGAEDLLQEYLSTDRLALFDELTARTRELAAGSSQLAGGAR